MRKLDWLVEALGLLGPCVDHEKAGVCGALVGDFAACCGAACCGSSQLAKPLLAWPELPLPLTSASKSSAVAVLGASNVVPVTPPKARKSSFGAAVEPLAAPESS